LLFAQTGLDHALPILYFLPSLGWQACVTTHSFFPLRWGSCKLFCASGLELPSSNLSLLQAWDDRSMSLHLAVSLMGYHKLFTQAGLEMWSSQFQPPK
jgi:hypothetical protein